MFERWRKTKWKVGDYAYDQRGKVWIIHSISRNQFVLQQYGTDIYHAEVRSSMERYLSVAPPSGV